MAKTTTEKSETAVSSTTPISNSTPTTPPAGIAPRKSKRPANPEIQTTAAIDKRLSTFTTKAAIRILTTLLGQYQEKADEGVANSAGSN